LLGGGVELFQQRFAAAGKIGAQAQHRAQSSRGGLAFFAQQTHIRIGVTGRGLGVAV